MTTGGTGTTTIQNSTISGNTASNGMAGGRRGNDRRRAHHSELQHFWKRGGL